VGLTMKERKAVTGEIVRRYRRADRRTKTKILDELIPTTRLNREHATAKQKLAKPMTSSQLILFGRLPRSHQIGNAALGAEASAARDEGPAAAHQGGEVLHGLRPSCLEGRKRSTTERRD